MSYRSNVGLVIKDEALLKLVNNNLNTKLVFYLAEETSFEDTKEHLYIWEDIKWNEIDHPDDVESIGLFMKELRNIRGEDYLFVRIGEDVEDNELLGEFYDNSFNFGFSRSLFV